MLGPKIVNIIKWVHTTVSKGNGLHLLFGLLSTISTVAIGFSLHISKIASHAFLSNNLSRFQLNSVVRSFTR